VTEQAVSPTRPLHPAIKAGLVAGIALVSGYCYIGILKGLEHSAPLRFASLRVLVAGVTILLAAMFFRQPLLPAPSRRVWVLPLGLFATALTYAGMFLAPVYAGAGLASILGNLQPLFVIMLAAIFLRERLTITKIGAVILGIAGVTIIVLSGNSGGFVAMPGVPIAILTSSSAAIGTVLVRYLAPDGDWLALAGWQLLTGGTMLLIASLLAGEPPIHWSPEFLRVLAFLALAETALVTVIWFWLLRRTAAGPLALNLFFVPVVGLLLAVLIGGESLRPVAWLGSAVVLTGVGVGIWGELGKNRKTRPLDYET